MSVIINQNKSEKKYDNLLFSWRAQDKTLNLFFNYIIISQNISQLQMYVRKSFSHKTSCFCMHTECEKGHGFFALKLLSYRHISTWIFFTY